MNIPQQQLTDFYADDTESSTRGILLYQNLPQLIAEKFANDVSVETPVSKCCSRFPQNVTAPLKPTDPMYVFSKWSATCEADSVADIANVIIDSIEGAFKTKCAISTNFNKCKIGVETPCGLVIKIKFFSMPENPKAFMVMFRKDSGDWFAFSSLFACCVKLAESRAISFIATSVVPAAH